jgi:hypothetical protein
LHTSDGSFQRRLLELLEKDGAHRFTAVNLMLAAGLTPDPIQTQVATTPGNQLLLCHRQWGKSTTVAAIALEDACSEPYSLVLLVSRSMRQSGELFRKVKHFYTLTQPLPLIQDSALSMELSNHSRIVSLPGSEDTIVGYSSVKRLIMDEAARIPDPTYYAVRPMLAMSKGSMVALSTPFGQRGWFYEAWAGQAADAQAMDLATVERLLADLDFPYLEEYSEGVTLPAGFADDTRDYGWTRTMVTAPENARISRRYLANERRTIPDLWFRQEWLCEFVETGAVVFRPEDLAAMLDDDVSVLDGSGDPYQQVMRGDVEPWQAGNGLWQHPS